ncbi:hypothetical protein [Paraburkholderia humisilvae]|uniref:Uncharacterized protein n=1 Tax=Paraburkholderia humisilvae TaxID=627669 RepID=A0A6J5DMW4_9BURK|nr:hypothetical protein LMG29542_02319 [Paraburkholderia humisilvae]
MPFRPFHPYVVFEAPDAIALQIHQIIGNRHAGGVLNYWWELTGKLPR